MPVVVGCAQKEDPAEVFAAAEQAFGAGDCAGAVVHYERAIGWGHQADHSRERIRVCQERLASQAARGLEKKHAVPIPDAGTAPAVPRAAGMSASVSSGGSVTRCDPVWRERIVEMQNEIGALEKKIQEVSQKTAGVETKYGVKRAGDGYDFSLPVDTPKEKVKEFQDVTAKEYAKARGEQDALKKRADDLRAKIQAVEAEAAKARVLRECLYPPAKGF
ncbi:MAG: hypothetical protein HY897_10000 [Deltaproteobacteria bacterium]|nr:hypothetical protein [Deltaproteobacteria bacterium]